MKIVIFCGSLEPGRCGLGDQVRRLTAEMIRQGHQAATVALNDIHYAKEYDCTQNLEGFDLPVLRLPSVWPSQDRFNRAKQWIEEFNPEWLSLQFVIFSFHPKGTPFGLGKQLANLGKGRRWHIMFQELWVGIAKEDSKKHILLGWIQKRIIQSLIPHLKPRVVHTSNQLFRAYLANLGVNAEYLPLFSNIPAISNTNVRSYSKQDLSEPGKPISFVIFGYIYLQAPVEQLAREAALYAKEKGVPISLTFLGRCGAEQERWIAAWKSEGLALEVLGEQPPERISEVLGNATVGIATTALAVIEKSSAVAVMRAHGLPVLCVSRPWQPRGVTVPEPPSDILEYRQGNFETCLAGKQNNLCRYEVSDVVLQLVDSLSANVHSLN